MRTLYLIIPLFVLLIFGCKNPTTNNTEIKDNQISINYFDNSGRDDVLSGGVKMIPIQTPSGEFNVWTKRIGNNPRVKVLILHGGPGANHEYFECFDSFFPKAGIEYYYYDQLESSYSDQPNDTSLWHIDRFVEEVEQVRIALGLNKENFFLLGQSWGGMLALEYALKYQENLKAIIISNMMASIPDYMKYADEVLGPQLDPDVLAELKRLEASGEYTSKRYIELVSEHYYTKHVLRMPLENWPEPVVRSFNNTNEALYMAMQGPSEFGVVGDARLKNWDRNNDLIKINVPTLTMGGAFDSMDPKHMKWMATQVQNGRYSHCPQGSHLSMYDDQQIYFDDLIRFIKDVDQGFFGKE